MYLQKNTVYAGDGTTVFILSGIHQGALGTYHLWIGELLYLELFFQSIGIH
jgi:hypothetical protein